VTYGARADMVEDLDRARKRLAAFCCVTAWCGGGFGVDGEVSRVAGRRHLDKLLHNS
jgi:hypothetical protein